MKMSAKKGRGAKLLKKPPDRKQIQEALPAQSTDLSDLSAVDKVGFLEGLRGKNSDAPLHSTALEEDLNPSLEVQAGGGGPGNKGIQRKATSQPRGAAVKRKEMSGGGGQKKKKKTSAGEEDKIRSEKVPAKESRAKVDAERKSRTPQEPQSPKTRNQPAAVGKKAAPKTPAPRVVKSQQTGGKKGKGQAKGQNPLKSQLPERSDPDTANQTSSRISLSDEENELDANWSPSPKKKARMPRLTAHRKSSSAKEDGASAKKTKTKTKQSRRPAAQRRRDADVGRKDLLPCSDEDRESPAVQRSRNVQNKQPEKATLLKELKVLRRENSKMNSLICTKKQSILEARSELMMAKQKLVQLQKKEVQLKKEVLDTRQGLNFLTNIRELNSQYLSHRHRDPKQRETYGASSLAALQMEAMYHKGSEQERLKDKTKTKTKK